ncbi:hypothetical protein LTR36_009857 [Oleoguttula mirabilis]|uniref:Uncharacterized protein n=1 Tax=Oleoguttula mirabilis TaxID=1507867 RepID=A0AAV9J5W9_9PEZI|nr:hypothetical protein LTR36_009857 [Oleoguttula mirabilis]
MHFTIGQTLHSLLAAVLVMTATVDAKKANYRIDLQRYYPSNCAMGEEEGKMHNLHNNKCKTFPDTFTEFQYYWTHSYFRSPFHRHPPKAYDDDNSIIKMHIISSQTLRSLFAAALLLAATVDAKKIDYKLDLQRYRDDDSCGEANKMGPEKRMHNNKCYIFHDRRPATPSFTYTWAASWFHPSPKKKYEGKCVVTAYSGWFCDGDEYRVDASEGLEQCHQPGFGVRSVSVTCNGNRADNH